jgi:hypothetical protein
VYMNRFRQCPVPSIATHAQHAHLFTRRSRH